ncbi:ciliary microtubule-associated protein 3 isoform X2 [Scyliorhinus torazame]|uniref:ciliary microtubule-associated protein 3 isoform X2 n=1 Tax=Scyliorhinus torazame TaxID=75743 RepID=UPI003B5A77CE
MAHKWTVKKKNLPTDIPDRKLFPLHWAPDRLGNEFPPIRGTPNCGPGRYDTYLKDSLTDNLEKKPESKIGYALGARTAIRFMPQLSESPGPAVYQRTFGKDQIFKPSSAPFGSTTPRGRWSPSNKLVIPGLPVTRNFGNTGTGLHISACTSPDNSRDWDFEYSSRPSECQFPLCQ